MNSSLDFWNDRDGRKLVPKIQRSTIFWEQEFKYFLEIFQIFVGTFLDLRDFEGACKLGFHVTFLKDIV